jgi:beta-RFAP synthase
MMQAVQTSPKRSVSVETTARLHMGFIDLNGGLGRRFGSIGLALDKPVTRLTASLSDEFSAFGPEAERALAVAKRVAARAGLHSGIRLDIQATIPSHAGLGSGTQLALAVGTAVSRLFQLEFSLDSIAEITGRGMRSGIGIGAFRQGGLLVDGGRNAATAVPPVIARMDFPLGWRILLVFDSRDQGVHGQGEVNAFAALPEFAAERSAHIARLILMQALPAVAERDLTVFGRAISEIQRIIGDHFGPAQGGGRYASAEVADAMAWLESQGVQCTGQSSWGPTGFAIVGSEEEAQRLQQELHTRNSQLQYEICQARNEGSIITDSLADQ